MPILGSNLVKTGVQGVIFDNSSSAACHIAKIMNFGQFGKKNQYFKGGEVLKIRNLHFFHKVGQIRTNTDGHYFFVLIFAPSELNDAAELFPY